MRSSANSNVPLGFSVRFPVVRIKHQDCVVVVVERLARVITFLLHGMPDNILVYLARIRMHEYPPFMRGLVSFYGEAGMV